MSFGYPAAFSDASDGGGRAPNGRRRRSSISAGRSVYEWAALLLVAAGPLLGTWLFGGVRLWSVGPLLLLSLAAAALYLLRPLFFRVAEPIRWPPGATILCLFLLYGAVRVPASPSPMDATVEVLRLAGYLFALWVWVGLSADQGRWRWLLGLLLLSVSIMAWYSIIQHANGDRGVLNLVRPEQYAMRASGAYFCPNHFANLLAISLPMGLAIALMPAAGVSLRLLSAYTALVSLYPLYLTASRSAWLGMAAGLTVLPSLLALRRGVGRALLALVATPLLLAAVGVLGFFMSPLVHARVEDAMKGNIRLSLWRDTLAMIADHPWFGYGPGSYRWVYTRYWRHLDRYLDPEFAHNDFLQLGAEYGVAGAFLLLGGLAYGLVRLFRLVRDGDAERGGYLIAGFIAAAAAAAIHACFDYNFHVHGNTSMLVAFAGVTLALLCSGGHLSSPRWVERLGRRASWFAIVPMLLALIAGRSIASYAYALRGDFDRAALRNEAAASAYKRAIRIQPSNGTAHRGLGYLRSAESYWNRDPESRQAQIEEGLAAFEHALRTNPLDLDSAFGRSQLLMRKGEPDKALALMRELVRLAPHHRDYWIELGLQLRSLRRYEDALEAFQRARSYGNTEQIELNLRFLRGRLSAPAE